MTFSPASSTYPAAAGVDASVRRAEALTKEALDALELFGDRAWALREIARFVIDRRN